MRPPNTPFDESRDSTPETPEQLPSDATATSDEPVTPVDASSSDEPILAEETVAHEEPDDDSLPTTRGWVRRIGIAVLAVLILVPVLLTTTGSFDLLAQSMLLRFSNSQPMIEADAVKPMPEVRPAAGLAFSENPGHPDVKYYRYFGLPLNQLTYSYPTDRLIPGFRELIGLYTTRQSEDDNFTVRVFDKRSGETLEIFVLDDERERYERTEKADWAAIDRLRRSETTRLVKKYAARGIPREAVGAKWGRRNQILEAREREAPFIDYEVRLANYLGLSLLATEIGTVETFNNDRLVSSVGARGRYQMMPYVLRQNDINHYTLRTAYGDRVNVYEEWHPLLTMEASFRLVRGYSNAVGHEIPGISSYHTGPGNMFKLFNMFLTEATDLLSPNTTVMDAYVWAVTDGYDQVSSETSFKTYSQGYIPSGYGALRAVEDLPVDTSNTFLGERVQLKPGKEIYLSNLLQTLEQTEAPLFWGTQAVGDNLYEDFRRMNQHMNLPHSLGEDGVPRKGNVLLTPTAGDAKVQFFLPLNSTEILKQHGIDLLDEAATFRFDRQTFRGPTESEKTIWDLQYEQLIDDIAHFGFTPENRRKLLRLADQFKSLAERNPSHYRKTQLDIIQTHKQLWQFNGWDRLAETTRALKGKLRLPVRPPLPIQPVPVLPPASASPPVN